MFKIIPEQEMLEKIDEALTSSLSDLLLIFPEIREKIVGNFLWGVFSETSPFAEQQSDKRHHEYLAYLSYDVIEKAKKELSKVEIKDVKFFADEVDKIIKSHDISIYLDYEDCDVLIEKNEVKSSIFKKDFEGIISVTLPDSSIIFESFLVKGDIYNEGNKWVYEYMDMYDEWKYKVMDKLSRYLWQIGGHGHWIQSDYNGSYIAQANIEIGDCGSVFIYVYNDEIKGNVDMY